MKTLLRVPTLEQYAYCEFEFQGTAEEAIAEYRRLTGLVSGGVGMDTKDFNRVLDEYLWGKGSMKADEYGAMNLDQKNLVQTIKRSKARNKTK